MGLKDLSVVYPVYFHSALKLVFSAPRGGGGVFLMLSCKYVNEMGLCFSSGLLVIIEINEQEFA